MHILEFDCVVCSIMDPKPQRMGLRKFDDYVAPNVWLAQCFGCGNLCVQHVDDTRITALDLS